MNSSQYFHQLKTLNGSVLSFPMCLLGILKERIQWHYMMITLDTPAHVVMKYISEVDNDLEIHHQLNLTEIRYPSSQHFVLFDDKYVWLSEGDKIIRFNICDDGSLGTKHLMKLSVPLQLTPIQKYNCIDHSEI